MTVPTTRSLERNKMMDCYFGMHLSAMLKGRTTEFSTSFPYTLSLITLSSWYTVRMWTDEEESTWGENVQRITEAIKSLVDSELFPLCFWASRGCSWSGKAAYFFCHSVPAPFSFTWISCQVVLNLQRYFRFPLDPVQSSEVLIFTDHIQLILTGSKCIEVST